MRSIRDRLANSWIGMLANRMVGALEFMLLGYYKKDDSEGLCLIRQVWDEEEGTMLFKPSELFMVWSLATSQRGLPGDYAEVGMFRGASAKVICEVKGDRAFHGFDTFEGLPAVGELDPRFETGMFRSEEAGVRKRLAAYPNVYIHKGMFPDDTGRNIAGCRFAFVHLDVDLYSSTAAALRFFYPRMVPGGIILSHDFSQCTGVRQAWREFMEGKRDQLIELPCTQVMLVKSQS
jgi:O-methyltransferase